MFGSNKFDPDTDIPDLTGKVVFITGGNNGLGKETALQLSKHNPAAIYITSRSASKGNAAISEIHTIVPSAALHLITLDLASLASVQTAAKQFLASSSRLDMLINNAGIMAVPDDVTQDGYEIQFGTNHLGHALLTKLLLPTLLSTSKLPGTQDVRIVTLTSNAHNISVPTQGIRFPLLRTAQLGDSRVAKYGQSKLANILHSRELARRFPELTCVSVHPGTVKTGLSKGMVDSWVMRSVGAVSDMVMGVDLGDGALNQLWAATGNSVVSSCYYVPVGKRSAGSVFARDENLAGELWDWTEKELQSYI